MKKLLLLSIIICASHWGIAQDQSTLDKDTTVDFETTTIDYGTIERDSDGVRTFTFTNTGDHPLKIYNIYSACNCDIVYQPDKPVKVNETSIIKVKYDTNKLGPIIKTITVHANTEQQLIPLQLTGEVIETKTPTQETTKD